MPTALIAPEPIRRLPGRYLDILNAAGITVVFPDGEKTMTEQELRRYLPETDLMMAGGERITAELLALAPRLKILARTGVGYDAIDVPAASARGIAVTITPGTNQESVAEQAFGLLLGVTRRVAVNDRIIREGGWERTLPLPLRGKTIGLVGLGRIGRAMVPRARAFGLEVIAYDPYAPAGGDDIKRVGFDELLAASDIVSLHLPVTETTRGLFRREVFAKMKPGAIFLNTARGGLVIEADLIEALNSGHLAGAGLDVFDPEPPLPSNPLLQIPTVVSSPHIAGIDRKSMFDMADLAAECMVAINEGRWPVDCMVNPEIAR